jgi:hypothetical protein
MSSRFVLLVAVIAAGALACQAPFGPGELGSPVPFERLRAEPYSFVFHSGLRESQRLVVRTPEALAETWAAIWARHSPIPELPDVDFTREMLVVTALGERPTGGYGILIDSAFETPSGITIGVRTISPGQGCVVTQAVTQPVDLARLARSDAPVQFRAQAEVHRCG